MSWQIEALGGPVLAWELKRATRRKLWRWLPIGMWGILQATVPYIIAYALPVFFLASVGGPGVLVIASLWIILPCTIVFVAALMGIDMLIVPPEMNETRQAGAFWFENDRAQRQPYKTL